MPAEEGQNGVPDHQPGFFLQLPTRRSLGRLVGFGLALRDVPSRRAGRVSDQQVTPVGHQHAAGQHAVYDLRTPSTVSLPRRHLWLLAP